MKRESMLGWLPLLAMVTAPLAAQDLHFIRWRGGYGALGFGGGNFKLTCDSGCAGAKLKASDFTLLLGHQFGRRTRGEVGFQYMSNRETSSNAFTATAGATVYLASTLHVSAGASYMRASVEESGGTYTGGGTGFSAGLGYDLFLGRRTALTPYVSYSMGSLANIKRAQGGWVTSQTSGRLKALHFGVAISILHGQWECTTTSGEVIRLSGRDRMRFRGCLDQVKQRLENGR